MNTQTTTHTDPDPTPHAFLAGASLIGAQGFAVAFAAMGLLSRIVSINIADANLNLAFGTLLYSAAGALGAAYLASLMQWKNLTLLFALSGILGCGGGYLVTSILLISRVQPETSLHITVESTYIVQHIIIGALFGLFLGIAIWDPKKLVLLILAGAIGFGIGYLMQASLNDLLAEALSDLVARFTTSDSVNLIVASLLWAVGSGLCGLLGGGAIGYALDN